MFGIVYNHLWLLYSLTYYCKEEIGHLYKYSSTIISSPHNRWQVLLPALFRCCINISMEWIKFTNQLIKFNTHKNTYAFLILEGFDIKNLLPLSWRHFFRAALYPSLQNYAFNFSITLQFSNLIVFKFGGKDIFLHFFHFHSVLVLAICHPSWRSLYFYPSQQLLKVSESSAGKCGS